MPITKKIVIRMSSSILSISGIIYNVVLSLKTARILKKTCLVMLDRYEVHFLKIDVAKLFLL